MFQAYCASCHGLDAKGTGPAARALKSEVRDLTVLTRNNRGQFPTLRVRQMIMGNQVVAAQGSREMPIWGEEFKASDRLNAAQVTARIRGLTEYIKSLQAK